MKRYNLLMALIASFLIVNGLYACTPALNSAFCNLTNYKDYSNVSVNSWEGNFVFNSSISFNTGTQSYFYLNTSYNNTLNGTSPIYLTIQGYSAAHTFLGNVTAFPTPLGEGLLIKNQTITGQSYNSITIWFNQITPDPTYLNGYIKNNTYYSNSNRARTIYNFGVPYLISYLIQPDISTHSLYGSSSQDLAGYVQALFNLNGSYILLAANNSVSTQNTNFTLNYIPYQYGTDSYTFYALNTLNQIINHGTLGNANVITHNANALRLYIDPSPQLLNQKILISHNLGINLTNVASKYFNNTQINGGQFGLFFQPDGFALQLKLNYSNATGYGLTQPSVNPYYYLIPAYSNNYSVTSTIRIANPVRIPIVGDNQAGWYFDYDYRIPINITSWNFSINTYAYAPLGNTSYLGKEYAYQVPNSPYLYLKIMYYDAFGVACQNTYFDAWYNSTQTELGSIPFALINCTSSQATFILKNTTNQGYTYSSFYIYFGSRSGLSGYFGNTSVKNSWETTYVGNVLNLDFNIAPAYFVSFNAPLNLGTNIDMFPINLTGSASGIPYTHLSTTSANRFDASTPVTSFLIDHPILTIVSATLDAFNNASCIGSWYSSNATSVGYYHTSCSNLPASTVLNITNSRLQAVFQRLFTLSYSIGAIQFYNGFPINNSVPNTTIILPPPKTPNTPINNSVIGNDSYAILNAKAELSNMGLNANVVFYGLTFPLYYFGVFAIIAILAIASMVDTQIHEGAEIPAIVLLIALWLVGLFVWEELILAIIVTLIIGVYYVEHRKSGRNG